MSDPPNTQRPSTVSTETRIHILLQEFHALYGLLTFRLTAMDRRLPAVAGTLGTVLGCTTAMPDPTRLAFLAGLPLALLWLVLTTVQHARSKEDHVRRIDEIERLVNRLTGEELLVFQSRHPNRARYPGGRTGFGSVTAVLTVSLIMLAACVYSVQTPVALLTRDPFKTYAAYVSICALLMLLAVVRLGRYRYLRPPHDGIPLFTVHRQDAT